MDLFQQFMGGMVAGGAYGGVPMQARPFNETYRCQPMAMSNRAELEHGDKILLPSAALEQLARLKVHYPMMFEVTNPQTGMKTHCGVMEFSAPEGVAYLPYWMMQGLFGDEYLQHHNATPIIKMRNVTLPKGTYVQLRPHRTVFTELSNPRVVLEKALRNFSCLTKNDTIVITHGDQKFRLDVMDVKPGEAISIIETDVNVDFAPPKDYVEPVRQPAAIPVPCDEKSDHGASPVGSPVQSTPTRSTAAQARADRFAHLGKGHSLSGKKSSRSRRSPTLGPSPSSSPVSTMDGSTESKEAPKDERFNYHYKTEKGQKKLVKRTVKRRGQKAAVDVFASGGNSLK